MKKNFEFSERCTNILTDELPVLRKMNNLTQQELGDIIGVSRQTITNIENGKIKMKWSIFLSIMFIFSLDGDTYKYLQQLDIPYLELKEWLNDKRK